MNEQLPQLQQSTPDTFLRACEERGRFQIKISGKKLSPVDLVDILLSQAERHLEH